MTSWSVLTVFTKIHAINPQRTYEGVARKIRHWQQQGFTKVRDDAHKTLRVGYLDIEACDLKAEWGYMLSWYIKKAGVEKYDYAVITKKEIFDEKFDKRIVKELLDALEHYDVLYTHWGSWKRYDLPFITTRAFVHNMEGRLSMMREKFIRDTWPIARRYLKLGSNRLDNIARTLNITQIEKTRVDPRMWALARVGNKKALGYVADHNKIDTQVLEAVHKKLMVVEKPSMAVM